MLTVRYGLRSSECRSHHALCWCPPLNSLVCCGGAPPLRHVRRHFLARRRAIRAAHRREHDSEDDENSSSSSTRSDMSASTDETGAGSLSSTDTGSRASPAGIAEETSVLLYLPLEELQRGACELAKDDALSLSFGSMVMQRNQHVEAWRAQQSELHDSPSTTTALVGRVPPPPSLRSREPTTPVSPASTPPPRPGLPATTAGGGRPAALGRRSAPQPPDSWVQRLRETYREEEEEGLDDSGHRLPAASQVPGVDEVRSPRPDHDEPSSSTEESECSRRGHIAALRWHSIRTPADPWLRYGHHLFCMGDRLYLTGGMYMQVPHLALADAYFDLRRREWTRVSPPLFPPRFYAALASTAAAHGDVVEGAATAYEAAAPTTFFLFGGVDERQCETNTLCTLRLPGGTCEPLVQLGATPPPQYRGVLVADVASDGAACRAGRLFYMDGFQRGRQILASLRCYDLKTTFWRRICSCPNLIGGQLAGMRYGPPPIPGEEAGAVEAGAGLAAAPRLPSPLRRLRQFDMFGGLPPREDRRPEDLDAIAAATGKNDTAWCLSFTYDVASECFHLTHTIHIPRVSNHAVACLPAVPAAALHQAMRRAAEKEAIKQQRAYQYPFGTTLNASPPRSPEPQAARGAAPLVPGSEVEEEAGRSVCAISFGGSQLRRDAVSTVYYLALRELSLTESLRLWMKQQHLAYRPPPVTVELDNTLEELF